MKKDGKISVLIVDDSDITKHSLKHFFEEYDLEVITSNDGLEGIQRAIEYKPNIIFLDLMMPNLNGIKMLQVIKVMNDLKHIPVVVISGNTNKQNVMAAIESGAEKVLSKPLKKEIIVKCVNEILGDEVLKKIEKDSIITEQENAELREQLIKFFLRSFPEKRKAIVESLENQNRNLLKVVIHEIKGTGGMIGYPELTVLSSRIMNKLSLPNVDWDYIRFEINELFNVINKIEFPKEENIF